MTADAPITFGQLQAELLELPAWLRPVGWVLLHAALAGRYVLDCWDGHPLLLARQIREDRILVRECQ